MTAITEGAIDGTVTSATRVSYVCMRPHHHRHRTSELRFSIYRHRPAICPSPATLGHEWMKVPELSLDVLAGLGWIPRDVAEDEEETAGGGVPA
ncbi:MAG TPA: hypothetical protein VLI88_02730 [Patescibacteria group bacterium]|nr:hypothetical protein [Patescibacteria group bacterium]